MGCLARLRLPLGGMGWLPHISSYGQAWLLIRQGTQRWQRLHVYRTGDIGTLLAREVRRFW